MPITGAAPYLLRVDPAASLRPPPAPLPDVTVARVFADPLANGDRATLALARTFVASPFFGALDDAVASFRPGVGMIVVGRLTESDLARLAAFEEESRAGRERLLLLGYLDVEDLTGTLADRLVQALGSDLGEASFQAIPRGGLVVLGLLAYHLGLGPRHLNAPPKAGAPVVVVDDCSISGRRFHEVLGTLPGDEPVIFATLLSHPELRRRIEEREERVRAAVSARDLEDRAPEILGGDYDAWLKRWGGRDVDGYWSGITEHVVFPWNEPDIAIWDAAAGDMVHGWRIAAPDVCLKNRLAYHRNEGRLQVHEASQPGLVPADDVVYATFEERLIVVSSSSGRVTALDGSAPLLWQALAEHDGPEEAATSLAQRIDLPTDELSEAVAAFAADMRERGLMRQSP